MTNFVTTVKNPDVFIKHSDTTFSKKLDKLPAGFYAPSSEGGMFTPKVYTFAPVALPDELINFTSGVVKSSIEKVKAFSDSEEKYTLLGFSHKMGMLFWGKPGVGKTSTVFLIGAELVKSHNFLFLDCTGKSVSFINQVIQEIREVQDNPIFIFVDEIDASIKYEEENWLTFLDGTNSFKNVIIAGCTNYVEKIPDRIKCRPSRIKHSIEITAFSFEVYLQYIKEKVKDIAHEHAAQIAFLCEEQGFTIDETKHTLINHFIEDMSIKEAIETVKTT